jgi:hypothetical protein
MSSRAHAGFLVSMIATALLVAPAAPPAAAAATDHVVTEARDDGPIVGIYPRPTLEGALVSPLLWTYGGAGGVAAAERVLDARAVAVSGLRSLPFTGVELITYAVLGSGLAVFGFFTRRQSRHDHGDEDLRPNAGGR